METFVYSIIHDGSRVLVFKKRGYGRFFKRQPVPELPDPSQYPRLHGADSYCFPGGAVEPAEEGHYRRAALRELWEETGLPQNNYTIDGAYYREIDAEPSGTMFGMGCFFRCSPEDLDTLYAYIKDQLYRANGVHWNEPDCLVQDNELKSVAIVPFDNLPGTYFASTPETRWFMEFIDKYKMGL